MTDYEEGLDEKEYRLAKTLRDNYCNKSGKETDEAKAGKVLHKIGQIYRKRSPDKISIIKSAGLFNAAIARNSNDISQIQFDLSEICKHILQLANANNQNADLVEKANEVKTSLNKLRKEVKHFLKTSIQQISEKNEVEDLNKLKITKISAIQKINKTIANQYKQVMAELAQFCQNVMGEPPCEYAVIGMGSLSREEITPYSDFEHIILLCDEKEWKSYLEYFRWYSVIFHVIILNLQETIVPSLNISSLNDKDSPLEDWFYDAITTRGVSFDGMMPHACKFPLGRQQFTKDKPFATELIKPVNKMLEYLSSDANLKNGYHLADILTKTCFVFGNENIFEQFELGVRKYRNRKSQTEIIEDVQEQVKKDLNRFSTRFRLSELKSQNQINIKQLVYRSTTVLISALARIYSISSNSSFDVINTMVKHNKITRNSANELQYAIAIACEMRLKVYTESNSQCDNISIDLKQDTRNIRKFVDIVGTASTIHYFQIAYCLQCEVAKQLNLKKLHFYSDPLLINITICLALGMDDLAEIEVHKIKFQDICQFDLDRSIKQIQTEAHFNFSTINQMKVEFTPNANYLFAIATWLLSKRLFDDAVEFNKALLHVLENKPKNVECDIVVADIVYKIGCILVVLHRYSEANTYLLRALQFSQDSASHPTKDLTNATMLCDVGSCMMHLHQYEKSFKYFNQALEIFQSASVDPTTDRNYADSLHEFGFCLMHLQKNEKGLHYLNQALAIYKRTTNNLAEDTCYSVVLNDIGYCLMDFEQYEESIEYLNAAHEIHVKRALDIKNDLNVAVTLSNIGRCLIGLEQYDESWKHLEQSLQIKLNRTLDEKNDHRIAYNYKYMGECLMRMGKLADALNYLQRALKIYETITVAVEKDTALVNTLSLIVQIGTKDMIIHSCWNCSPLEFNFRCTTELQQYAVALDYLKKSLKTYKNISQSQHIKIVIESIRSKIGQCLTKLK